MAVLMIVLSVFIIFGGINCIMTPVATFSSLGWLTSCTILLIGIVAILRYAAGHENRSIWQLTGGICGVLFGGFLTINAFAQVTASIILAYAAAGWLLVHGICSIVESLKLKRINSELDDKMRTSMWLVILISGVLTALMGIACVFEPMISVFSVGMLMGVSILISGIKTLLLAVQIMRTR